MYCIHFVAIKPGVSTIKEFNRSLMREFLRKRLFANCGVRFPAVAGTRLGGRIVVPTMLLYTDIEPGPHVLEVL